MRVLPGPTIRKVRERRSSVAKPEPRDNRLLLSIPRLGLKNVTVGGSPERVLPGREGITRLSRTSFPYKRGSKAYIVGHTPIPTRAAFLTSSATCTPFGRGLS